MHDSGSHRGPKKEIIMKVNGRGGVLITTYESVRINIKELLRCHWEYMILDEGKNKNIKISK